MATVPGQVCRATLSPPGNKNNRFLNLILNSDFGRLCLAIPKKPFSPAALVLDPQAAPGARGGTRDGPVTFRERLGSARAVRLLRSLLISSRHTRVWVPQASCPVARLCAPCFVVAVNGVLFPRGHCQVQKCQGFSHLIVRTSQFQEFFGGFVCILFL